MQPVQLAKANRCLAKTRKGAPCQSPAVKGRRRCRLHGGMNPGAPTGKAHGRYRHGLYTKAHLALKAALQAVLNDLEAMDNTLG